jgi:Ca2+-binding RTX toxin-like protein
LLIAASPAATTLLGGAGFDYMSRQITPGPTGVIDGGPGENQLELDPQLWIDTRRSAALDAATGTAVVTAGERTQTTTFSNVGAFTLWGAKWAFRGTEADDFVQVLDGRLDAQAFGGDDFMIGAQRRDVLDGGDGTDEAWGGKGRNTCLNTETGSCTGYPWEQADRRISVAAGGWTGVDADTLGRLVSRWTSPPALVRAVDRVR